MQGKVNMRRNEALESAAIYGVGFIVGASSAWLAQTTEAVIALAVIHGISFVVGWAIVRALPER